MSGSLTTYGEFADLLGNLPMLVRERRRALGLTMRDTGREVGVSISTICRIEAGEDASTVSLLAILRWLDRPLRPQPERGDDDD